jgi:hypothetical protein
LVLFQVFPHGEQKPTLAGVFPQDAPLYERPSLLDQQVELLTDTFAPKVHVATGWNLGSQDGKLQVFKAVAIGQGFPKVASPELFPRTHNLNIGSSLNEHPEVIGKPDSGVFKVSLKLFLCNTGSFWLSYRLG